MLIKIAWRNVWRNKARSIIVILSIAVGLTAGIFYTAFSFGMINDHLKRSINEYLSHIQIHHPDFDKTQQGNNMIEGGEEILSEVSTDERVKASTGRTLVGGMVSSANSGSGAVIFGIMPQHENEVTSLKDKVIEGDYFEGIKRNPVLIGKKLAEKLKVNVRNKIVLTFQDANGDITAGAFRVVGIYKSINASYEEMNVYVRMEDLNRLKGNEDKAMNEIAILLNSNDDLDQMHTVVKNIAPNQKVETWKELSSELEYMVSMFKQYMYIFIGIILLALIFGIVNTMLMAVLERTRELGMLMSIGLNKVRIFFMIVLETVFLSLVGGPMGIAISAALVAYFGNVGVDLSMFSTAFEQLGYSSIIYPEIEPSYYIEIGLMAVGAAVFAAIYPARKALQLNPSEAVRKI